MAMSAQTKRTIVDVALFLASQAALFYTVRWVLYPERDNKKLGNRNVELLKSRGHGKLQLTEHEKIIAAEVVHPDDINVLFSDIGGLDPIISSLRESVIYPLLYPSLFPTTSLLSAPKGVLLFGPPGCGKTMLAKALAKESGATFINIAASTITNKWYGESNKLVAGMFGLARKTQPAIIFIDEIDSFLRQRGSNDHDATGMMKAEFMTLWDGLTSATDRIIVLGATNRPGDIDAAFLRRMPKRFGISLPDVDQRHKILSLMLHDTPLAPDLDLRALAERAERMSGSDLKELCRNAAMIAVRERMQEFQARTDGPAQLESVLRAGQSDAFRPRPLTMSDFERAGESFLAMLSNGTTGASSLSSLKDDGDVDDVLEGEDVSEIPVPIKKMEDLDLPIPPQDDRSRIDEPIPERE